MRDAVRDATASYAPPRVSWRLWLIRLLALAGMGVAGYLTWAHLANQSVACGQSHGCDIVQQSVYSEVGGGEFFRLNLRPSVL